MNKMVLGTALSVLLVALPGCKKSGPSSSDVSVRFVKGFIAEDAEPGPLDIEVANQAIELWKPTKIGELYYLYVPGVIMVESRGKPVITVSRDELSESDKLNGIEWRRGAMLAMGPTRRYHFSESPSPFYAKKGWSTWQESWFPTIPTPLTLERKGGKWTISGPIQPFSRVTEADIPK